MQKLLKPLLLIALCAFLVKQGWQYYEDQQSGKISLKVELPPMPSNTTPAKREVTHPSMFKCDGRRHCAEMTSCEEAEFFLKSCPSTQLDADGNGIPCEKVLCD